MPLLLTLGLVAAMSGLLWIMVSAAPDPEAGATADPGERGSLLYGTCSVCHGPKGEGQAGKYPPLATSALLRGPAEPLAAMVLHGVLGGTDAAGRRWPEPMPPQRTWNDRDIAAVLSYARRRFAGIDAPVDPAQVLRVRLATESRDRHYSRAEIETFGVK